MRLKTIRIQNLRAIKDQTVNLDPYTSLVGANGAGKSTVLAALNIFFRETAESRLNLTELQAEDFHCGNTAEPISITVTFSDLDRTAQEDFADYCRQGELVVTAVAEYDASLKRAAVVQYGERLGMGDFAPCFVADKDKAKVDELKRIFAELRVQHPELKAATTKPAMVAALREYEEAHADLCRLLRSSDQFYGFSKGVNRLQKHVQWIFVPAVKDASAEEVEAKDTALGRLLSRAVDARANLGRDLDEIRSRARSAYEELIDNRQESLDALSSSLQERMGTWAHPGARLKLQWQLQAERAVTVSAPVAEVVAGEGRFDGRLTRLGHGFQRAYLLALLQELYQAGSGNGPTLILAIEEPELYQHPPQCRHLASVLHALAVNQGQVIVATHSPYFVVGESFESVRLARRDPATGECLVAQVEASRVGELLRRASEDPPKKPEGVRAKIEQCLRPALSEIFFSPHLILVEGREDIAYIVSYLALLGKYDDVRRTAGNFVAADGKRAMIMPLAIVKSLEIPTFVVFDSDGHLPDNGSGRREQHRRDNTALLRLVGVSEPDPFPSETFWGADVVMWPSEIAKVISADYGDAWGTTKAEIEVEFGQVGDLDKNPLFISRVMEELWSSGLKSATLGRLCDSIIEFCEDHPQNLAPSSEQTS